MDAFAAADVYTDKEWDRVMMINLTVPTRMIRAVLPFMKATGNGSIINVASKAATSGAAAGVAYTASKHGLVSFVHLSKFRAGLIWSVQLGVTKNTAWRFHEEGIRCNAILPGGTNLSPDRSGVQILINVPAIIDTNLGDSIEAENFDETSYQHQA